MKRTILSLGLICSSFSTLFAQFPLTTNEFKIGMFGGTSTMTQNVSGCDVPYETPLNAGNKTSVLNVLAEDGFNIIQTYAPNEWSTENSIKGFLKLANANGMKVELGAGHYYKPTLNANGTPTGSGTNVYDNCGNNLGACQTAWGAGYFRSNINNHINNIYKVAPYKDIIWGYHICEEASYFHWAHTANNCLGSNWANTAYFRNVELPPANVNSAISYYKSQLASAGITNHKMVVMEANHHKNINASTIDGEGIFNPQHYIGLLNPSDKRDVFFEGSYTQFPTTGWNGQDYQGMFSNGFHYLGPFKSIDFAKNSSSDVHKVISIMGTADLYGSGANPNFITHFNSGAANNGNWLWFQAYNSIIHGVNGVWFWDLAFIRNQGEADNWANTANLSRYERNYFPANYRNFVGYLAKEIRYLVNQNIISTDPRTIVATKLDGPDQHCIVPGPNTYMPSSIPNKMRTEEYGLRYTIRTNGTETYMIVTNPLNVALTATLNFGAVANQQIRYSQGVNVVFEAASTNVSSTSYKVNRNSGINLTGGTGPSSYFIPYPTGTDHLVTLSFGPMDVKVLKFVSDAEAFPDFNNGWNLAWTNGGNGSINGHRVTGADSFYPGDFDGDGTEELLCVTNATSGTDWITLLKYVNNEWTWLWSNYGSTTAGNGIYQYRKALVVGDFDGDNKDELVGNDAWTTMFKFNNGNWQWIWSDNGNASHPIRPFKKAFYAGDFDGNGKDELLGADLPNGWTTSFNWNGSDFAWGWSDNGNTSHPLRSYRTNMRVGDFDGDGKDELLGLSSWATLFHYENANWNWGWSTYGASNIAGWNYPLASTDRAIPANFDTDAKDELMILQTNTGASTATTMELNADQSNWTRNWNTNSAGFLDDWRINPANGYGSSRYYAIKVKANEPSYLLAMRGHCSNFIVNMYKPSGNKSLNNTLEEEESLLSTNSISSMENQVRIFPNPTEGHITVVSRSGNLVAAEIQNMDGKLLQSVQFEPANVQLMDLSEYPSGIYFIKTIEEDETVTLTKVVLNQ